MAMKRLSMRKTREILRLHFVVRLSTREIGRSCNVGRSTAHDYVGRAKAARLEWADVVAMTDDALDSLLFPSSNGVLVRPAPLDFQWIHRELRRKHVTKQLLWEEYRGQHANGYGYSQFCQLYLEFTKRLSVTMRQSHKAGERLFVDFSGDGITIHDKAGGEPRTAKLFLAVLGASNLTYVEAVLSEDLPTWTGCHVRAFAYFGGVTEITVPDNLKSGVTRPDYYDPEINKTYGDLAAHYGTTVIPARVRKPRDKAKVEQGVLLAERWIIAVLRHRRFCTLAEVQEAIAPLLEKLNNRRFQKLDTSRRQLFEEIERPALKPLPIRPYEFAHWKKVTVNIDYHIEYDRHYYSVPYIHARSAAEVRATESCVEVLVNNKRVASHVRSFNKHTHTTCPEHRPKSHQRAQWSPSRLIAWGQCVGPHTGRFVEEILQRRAHPEQGYRSCLGLLRLRDQYPDARLERACARAAQLGAFSRKSVLAILRNNMESAQPRELASQPVPAHENIRGAAYYR